jgi:spoIIIJ-associated protein
MEKNKEQEQSIGEEVKDIIKELVEKMGFSCEVEMKSENDGEKESIVCNIKTEDSNFLIGQYGVNLQSLQHVSRLIVRKKFPDQRISFILDVNEYRQEKNQSVVKIAQEFAEQAISEKRAVVMRPMSPYERRIVHLELSKNDKVSTDSIGEAEDRRVVIKPIELV